MSEREASELAIKAIVLALHRGESIEGMDIRPALALGLVEVLLTVEGEDKALEWEKPGRA